MSNQDITFTIHYAVSLIVVLSICIYLMKNMPNLHPLIIIAVGLVVAYIFTNIIYYVMPSFTTITTNISQYAEYSLYSNLNDLGYLNIWPPVFVVLIALIILLYNGQIRFSPSSNYNIKRN